MVVSFLSLHWLQGQNYLQKYIASKEKAEIMF